MFKYLAKSSISLFATTTLYYSTKYILKYFEIEIAKEEVEPYILGCLLGSSLIYPLDQIGLTIFFKPIDIFINLNLQIDPNKNIFNKGNFKPVTESIYKLSNLDIYGQIPKDFNGVYIRNGPNRKLEQNVKSHLFEGEAMIHAIRIQDQEVYYCCRWAQSDIFKYESEIGYKLSGIGYLFSVAGLCKAVVSKLKQICGYLKEFDELRNSYPNTSIVHHAKSTYAVVEINLPFKIQIKKGEKGLYDIESLGFEDFSGDLKHGISAHPKIDSKTNIMYAFNYNIMKPEVYITSVDSNKKVIESNKFRIASTRMLHDFLITQNYCIIPDLPLEFNMKYAGRGNMRPYILNKEKYSNYMLIYKNDLKHGVVMTFNLKAHMVFHYVNSFETKNINEERIIKIFACASEDFSLNYFYSQDSEHPFGVKDYYPKLTKIELNLTTGENFTTILIDDNYYEFPLISQSYYGYENQYAYMSEKSANEFGEAFDAVMKYDLKNEMIVGRVEFGLNCYSGEVFYHMKDGAQSEDDGYLMTCVWNCDTEETYYVVWDSKTMNQEPIFRVKLKTRVPYGFHTYFVDSKELDQSD